MTTRQRAFVLAASAWVAAAATSWGATPAQFRVWGGTGPKLPAMPAGWREIVTEASGATWTPTQEDRRRAFVLFVREPMTRVSPYDRGFAAEQVKQLSAVAARGEYEPVGFLIHALEPLGDVRVEVGELRGENGGVIPFDHVDVRVARCIRVQVGAKDKTYRLEPFLLERRRAFRVGAGRTRRVWLTLKAPEAAKAGAYAGTITVRAAGRPAAALKLNLRVLPLILPRAPIEMAVFYPRPPKSDDMLSRQLIDAREHGCGGVEPAMEAQIASRDRTFGRDDVEATVRHCRRMIRAAKEVFGERRAPMTFGVGHQIAYYWDQGRNWFAFWPHDGKIESDLLRAIDAVAETTGAAGGAKLRVYALDEAGAHNLLDEAVHYYRLIKQHRPALRTWTTIGGGMAMGLDEIGRLSEHVDVFTTNRFTPAIARRLVRRSRPYGIYNGAGGTPAGARFFYGFHGWKTGAEQIAQWCYHFGNGVFEGAGLRRGDEGYVYLAEDDPLPSLMWEAVREGIDDYRYVSLLWRMIAAAKASGGAARKAAEGGEQALRRILGEIGWRFQALDGSDRTPPPHPSTLRKWRREVVRQILKLRPLVADAAVARAPARPASPFDLPWAEPDTEKPAYGPELLGVRHFKPPSTPWLVQAWKGKGAGRPDEKVRRGDRASMRIQAPAGSAGDSVTVLVWPSWGDKKLKLPLAGGRTYEFSTYAKWKDRSAPPTARIALPSGAAATTRNGKDAPDAAGWQRTWTRVETNVQVVPKYLALWVQGPGTVWAAEPSLREVIPPPMRLALDQRAYDAADAVGIASVTVSRGVTPARVRFTLREPGGRTVARRTAPFRAEVPVASPGAPGRRGITFLTQVVLRRCRIVFGPSALPPGGYEVKVELLDAQGETIAGETATFQRLAE